MRVSADIRFSPSRGMRALLAWIKWDDTAFPTRLGQRYRFQLSFSGRPEDYLVCSVLTPNKPKSTFAGYRCLGDLIAPGREERDYGVVPR